MDEITVNWMKEERSNSLKAKNIEIYGNIKNKAREIYYDYQKEDQNLLNSRTCYELVKRNEECCCYKLLSNPNNLSEDQIALIMDFGSLAFGYDVNENIFTIYDVPK